MVRKRVSVVVIALALAAFAAAPAGAAAIGVNQWYTFGFGGPGSDAVDGGSGFTLGQNSLASGPPPWTITIGPLGATFTVTDGFLSGDNFEVFDFGGSIGTTPAVATGDSCGNDEPGCLANPLMSHAAFALAPGDHSLTITVLDSPFGSGAAFFRVDGRVDGGVIPEPGSLLLLGTGLVAAGYLRRRRAG